jgi:hypothetical protein
MRFLRKKRKISAGWCFPTVIVDADGGLNQERGFDIAAPDLSGRDHKPSTGKRKTGGGRHG